MNEIELIALPILKKILKEAQDIWADPDSKYREYRTLQIDKRGSFGERIFGKLLEEAADNRRFEILYKDGDQGDWDLKFNGKKFEVKTSSLDVNKKFQNEGLKKDGDYDGVLFLGVAPNDLYFRCFRKDDFDFDGEKESGIGPNLKDIDGNHITNLHDRGKDGKDENATGAGFKCDIKLTDMKKIESIDSFKKEIERYFDLFVRK